VISRWCESKETPPDRRYDMRENHAYGASWVNLVMIWFESFNLKSWKFIWGLESKHDKGRISRVHSINLSCGICKHLTKFK